MRAARRKGEQDVGNDHIAREGVDLHMPHAAAGPQQWLGADVTAHLRRAPGAHTAPQVQP